MRGWTPYQPECWYWVLRADYQVNCVITVLKPKVLRCISIIVSQLIISCQNAYRSSNFKIHHRLWMPRTNQQPNKPADTFLCMKVPMIAMFVERGNKMRTNAKVKCWWVWSSQQSKLKMKYGCNKILSRNKIFEVTRVMGPWSEMVKTWSLIQSISKPIGLCCKQRKAKRTGHP